jgi:hypothetical protein
VCYSEVLVDKSATDLIWRVLNYIVTISFGYILYFHHTIFHHTIFPSQFWPAPLSSSFYHRVLVAVVKGRRQRGRSKLRWEDGVMEDGVMEDARKLGERN